MVFIKLYRKLISNCEGRPYGDERKESVLVDLSISLSNGSPTIRSPGFPLGDIGCDRLLLRI